MIQTGPMEGTKDHWVEVIPHRPDVLLSSMEIFQDYLVLKERVNGLNELRIVSWSTTDGTSDKDEYLQFDDGAYSVDIEVGKCKLKM